MAGYGGYTIQHGMDDVGTCQIGNFNRFIFGNNGLESECCAALIHQFNDLGLWLPSDNTDGHGIAAIKERLTVSKLGC